MIRTRAELKEYIEKDKIALGIKKKHPSLLGDAVWKFQIALRKREYFEYQLVSMGGVSAGCSHASGA